MHAVFITGWPGFFRNNDVRPFACLLFVLACLLLFPLTSAYATSTPSAPAIPTTGLSDIEALAQATGLTEEQILDMSIAEIQALATSSGVDLLSDFTPADIQAIADALQMDPADVLDMALDEIAGSLNPADLLVIGDLSPETLENLAVIAGLDADALADMTLDQLEQLLGTLDVPLINDLTNLDIGAIAGALGLDPAAVAGMSVGELSGLLAGTGLLGGAALGASLLGGLFGGGGCCACICAGCVTPEHLLFREIHSPTEFEEHRRLLIEDFWYGNMVPILMMVTEQMTVMALEQLQMIGAFLDAKTQLETQDTLRKLQAQAHKDYRPSVGLCELGTVMRSLHASDARSDWTKLVLTHRAMQRNLGTRGTSAMRGRVMDIDARLNQYVDLYCDPRDFNRGTQVLCEATATPAERRNADIDWPRSVAERATVAVDFTLEAPTTDEVDVFALMSYLYGHDAFTRIPPTFLRRPEVAAEINPLHDLYLDLRAVVAKRNVAENSYAHQVAMRAQGTELAVEYLTALLLDLGIPEERIIDVLGEKPSYYQQMEVLTKLIYYNPDFYVNLYETPANVLRKRVALQAIGLLQKWDTLQSMWRSEMLAAVAAEVRLSEDQADLANEISQAVGEGRIRAP